MALYAHRNPTASVGMCFNASLEEQDHSSNTISDGPSWELKVVLSLKSTDKARGSLF